MLGPAVRPLDALLQPGAFLRVLHVHVLDADSAAVRVAQHAEYLPQPHPRRPAETAGGEFPLEIPERQAVLVDVKVRVLALLVLQRVGVRHEMTAYPVGVDELMHASRLAEVILVPGRDVPDPPDRLVRYPQRLEYLVVEAVLAEQ